MIKTTRLTTAFTLALILALTGACVGRESPFSLLNLLRGAGAPTATPTLPVPPLAFTATPTLPPPPTLPVASPTPETGAQADAVVTADSNVNLRQGPGTGYPVVGMAGPGTPLQVLGRNADSSWFQVQTAAGLTAWIWGGLITLSVPAAGLPVVEAAPPPTPAGGQAGQPPGGAAGGPLEFSWSIVGTPRDDPVTNTSYHTIVINARGGSGVYTYYRDGQPLSSNQFILAWVTCGGLVATSIRVDSSDGQSVTQTIGFNAFCPTPYGCDPTATDCHPWSP